MIRKLILIPGLVCVLALAHTANAQQALINPTGNGMRAAAGTLLRLGQMPEEVKESSGLAPANQPEMYYTLGDAGNEAVLFKVNTRAQLLDKIRLNIPNTDWESMAHDNSGNLYICDCGNNSNARQNLAIYRVNPEEPGKTEKISFRYPDQRQFPPKKKERNFDSEGSFWHQGNLYLFSRDRGRQQTSKVYRVPASPGNHEAELLASLTIPGEVTGAAISKAGTRMALLTKEGIFLFTGTGFPELLKAKPERLSNQSAGQTEGVEFMNEQTLLISSEEGGLFTLTLP